LPHDSAKAVACLTAERLGFALMVGSWRKTEDDEGYFLHFCEESKKYLYLPWCFIECIT
jgi:hypothetical protein